MTLYGDQRPHLDVLSNARSSSADRRVALNALASVPPGGLSPEGYDALTTAPSHLIDEALAQRIESHVGVYSKVEEHLAAFHEEAASMAPSARASRAIEVVEHPEMKYAAGDPAFESLRSEEAERAADAARHATVDTERATLQARSARLDAGRPEGEEEAHLWDALSNVDPAGLSQAELEIANGLLDRYPARAAASLEPHAETAQALVAKTDAYRDALVRENAVHTRAGFSHESHAISSTPDADRRLLADVQRRVDTLGPAEARRALGALERTRARGEADDGDLQHRLRRRLPIAEAQAIVASAEVELASIVDQRGAVGDVWDGARRLIGADGNSAEVEEAFSRLRDARDQLAQLEDFSGTDDAYAEALAARTASLSAAASEASTKLATHARSQDSLAHRASGAAMILGGLGESLVGLGLVGAPEPTLVSKAAGAMALVHGVDLTTTGAAQVWTGEADGTRTFRWARAGLETAGVDPAWSTAIAGAVDFLPGLAASGAVVATRRAVRGSATAAAPRPSATAELLFPEGGPSVEAFERVGEFDAFARMNPDLARRMVLSDDLTNTSRRAKALFKDRAAKVADWEKLAGELEDVMPKYSLVEADPRYRRIERAASNHGAQPRIALNPRPVLDSNGAFNVRVSDTVLDTPRFASLHADRIIGHDGPLKSLDEVLQLGAHGNISGFAGLSNRGAAKLVADEIERARGAGVTIEHVVLSSCMQRNLNWANGRSNAQAFEAALRAQMEGRGLTTPTVYAARDAGPIFTGSVISSAQQLRNGRLVQTTFHPASEGARLGTFQPFSDLPMQLSQPQIGIPSLAGVVYLDVRED